jgi:transposase
MSDLTKLNEENSNRILDIVAALQPVTAQRVLEELARQHGVEAELGQVVRYMEWLRSGFPRKLSHAGPDLWLMVDLS